MGLGNFMYSLLASYTQSHDIAIYYWNVNLGSLFIDSKPDSVTCINLI